MTFGNCIAFFSLYSQFKVIRFEMILKSHFILLALSLSQSLAPQHPHIAHIRRSYALCSGLFNVHTLVQYCNELQIKCQVNFYTSNCFGGRVHSKKNLSLSKRYGNRMSAVFHRITKEIYKVHNSQQSLIVFFCCFFSFCPCNFQ